MCEADNLPPYSADVKKSRSLNFLDPSRPAWPVTGVLYFYLYLYCTKWDRCTADLLFLVAVHEGKTLFKKYRVQMLKRGGGDAHEKQTCEPGTSHH